MSTHDDMESISSADDDSTADLNKGGENAKLSTLEGDDSSKQSGGSGSVSGSSSRDKKEKFVQKESKYIHYLRLVVVLILLLTAIAVCCVVFFITDGSENANVETSFDADAMKVLETFMDIATNKLGAAGSIIVAIVAHGIDHELGWPWVTLSFFQERASIVKSLSDTLRIEMSPIIKDDIRAKWENYSVNSPDRGWWLEGRKYQQVIGIDDFDERPLTNTEAPLTIDDGIGSHIFVYESKTVEGVANVAPKNDWYLPVWQTSPVAKRSIANRDHVSFSEAAVKSTQLGAVVFDGLKYSEPGYSNSQNAETAEIAWLLSVANRNRTYYQGDIYSSVFFPLYDVFFGNRTTVGVMHTIIHWARYFRNVLPDSSQGIVFVLDNGCETPYTYRIDGNEVIPVGHGDLHDPKYDHFEFTATHGNITRVEDGTADGMILHHGNCPMRISVYPSDEFVESFQTSTPMVITLAVAIVFVFTIIMFFVYDWLVERRQKILLAKATRSHQIVASFFPKHVRDQILADSDLDVKKGRHLLKKNGMDDDEEDREIKHDAGGLNEAPIADLFPEASVLFADIAGFTAWSSSREPQQVFILLQNVYQAFDTIAKSRKVFKVETVGDSYVAASGVPEPQPTHAVIMARFAWECLLKMNQITRDLESTLGPDTGELSMRFGIHSGPVTAGVLRGERSRFQLFGDTVNTASRMESTGVKGRIQCSQSTAEALTIAGKEHWLRQREDVITAKGKGVLKTFWLVPNAKAGSQSGNSDTTGRSECEELEIPQEIRAQKLMKRERQVDWVTELLGQCIRSIVAKQEICKGQSKGPHYSTESHPGHIPLDDIVDVIRLPEGTAKASEIEDQSRNIKLPEKITSLLRQYVSIIASAYIDNPFHNFEHACHVTMCVHKFLKRVKLHGMNQEVNKMITGRKAMSTGEDYTNMIHSDPVTHLAVVFSAIIHDVDHQGVSNIQLGKEDPDMAARYREKSLAEQNSFEIAWDLLMADHFEPLRNYVFASPDELLRFRQIVINVVLATDIFDKELNDQRKNRWKKAFEESSSVTEREANALRATVVIEHIMQASDVSHVMQHWHVYQKWNRKLFFELAVAHHTGRMAANPAEFWYKGELSFFDNYIIPLARKLQDCAVFGVSSDECLNYAIRNRAEWEARGEALVAEMVQDFETRLKHQQKKPKLLASILTI